MTDTSTGTPTEAELMQDLDFSPLRKIYIDAREVLDEVHETRGPTGSLSDIGRIAILHYRQGYGKTYPYRPPRSPNGQAPKRKALRFSMPREVYAQQKALIHADGVSVTRVVEEALLLFTKTRKFPWDKL